MTWLIDLFWQAVAFVLVRCPFLINALKMRGFGRPYTHIRSRDGADLYMGRYWLLNPYKDDYTTEIPWFPWCLRLHFIRREDTSPHLHSHPWPARTIILEGWYKEECEDGVTRVREAGYTGRLRYGQFHRISEVSPGGVWTLFIVRAGKPGKWHFLVDGEAIPSREYLSPEFQQKINLHQ